MINKVIFGDEVLIDLTADTVSANTLLAGYYAHTRSGERILGTAVPTQTTVTVSGGSVSKITGTTDDYRLTLS